MKKFLLSSIAIGFLAVSVFFISKSVSKSSPSSVASNDLTISEEMPSKAKRIAKGLEWRYKKLINEDKGYFDASDLQAALNRADFLQSNAAKQSAALGLQWDLIGPDNQGGRTRALMFDVNNPNKLWAGSVGGGLFSSLDGGANWTRVESYNGFFPIASIAQGSDGAIYVGTGEGLGNPLGFANSSYNTQSVGNGVYKSIDDGATWTQLTATIDPVNDEQVTSGSCRWCGVNALEVSPINPAIILAGTEGGLQISDDGGLTFSSASGALASGQIQSIEITSDGQIAFAVREGRVYRSVSVADNFQTGWTAAPNVPSGRRADVAIAPSNENYVYASVTANNNCMTGIYRSIDGGDNWTEIVERDPSYKLDPFNQPTAAFGSCEGQGWYDQTIAVNPADENKIYIGGIVLYTWGEGIGFRKASIGDTEGGTPFDSDYIHVDKHEIIFSPLDPTGNTMIIGNDGGIVLCKNALSGFPEDLSFIQRNKGYATTQVYGMGAGAYGEVMSGNQDNSSQYIDGLGSSVAAATEVGSGDGVYAEVSNLDPDVLFAGSQFGNITRSVNRGQSVNSFTDSYIDQASCGKITCSGLPTACNSNYTDFIYPFYLLETSTVGDPVSRATLIARDDTLLLANGSTQIIRDTLYPDRKITTTTTISETETIVERVEETKTTYDVTSYVSPILTFEQPLTTTVLPGDTLLFPDPYDAKYFATSTCGLWMCINPLQKGAEPHFYKISNSSSNIASFDASGDGDKLYYVVGSSLYIVEGLNQVTASLDINEGCANSACTNGTSINVIGPISLPVSSSPGLEGVAVDKNDPTTVLVTAGGFSSAGKVFRVENALSGSPSVVPLQSTDATLPYMPIYDCIIDADNPDRYILGTELGIWTSDDAGITWTEENNGLFGRMPIYRVRQEWMYEEGCNVLYAGTHGGGMFRSTTLTAGGCDVTPYKWPDEETSIMETPLQMTNVSIYPNPVVSSAKVEFNLQKNADVTLRVFDMMGKLVYADSYNNLASGVQTKELNASDFSTGTYSVVLSVDGKIQGNRLLVKK